jgi:hypothetical protein
MTSTANRSSAMARAVRNTRSPNGIRDPRRSDTSPGRTRHGQGTKATAPDKQSIDGYDGAFAEIDDYTIAFEEYSADADLAALFVGLPDDRCQSPH